MTVHNDTTNILKLYLLLQNTLNQSEATEPPGTVASLSSNSLSESRNTLFETRSPTCSRGHPIPCILQSPPGFHGVLMESSWSPRGVLMESMRSLHGVLVESSWTP